MKHFYSVCRKLHKWLALLVGVQVLLWAITGILFGFVQSSNTYRNIDAEQALNKVSGMQQSIDLSRIVKGFTKQQENTVINRISTYHLLNSPYLRLVTDHGDMYLDGDGKLLVISEQMAMKVANQSYTGAGALIGVEREGSEWLVSYEDELNTQVVVSAVSGRVVKHQNNHSAFADLLKILHFMDYFNEHKFNHWWLQFVAVLAFLFTLTGCYWTFQLLKVRYKRLLKH